jgi:hypothetical protein
METSERTQVLDQFAASEQHLLQLVEGLTPEQLVFRTAPDRWSIAEIVEHVIAVETRIVRAIGKMITQPSTRAERPNPAPQDAILWKHVSNRGTRLTAPEPVRPTWKFIVAMEMTTHFRSTRSQTVQFVTVTDADLRCHSIPHMAFGELDSYQWLIVLSLHGTRHAAQIEEVKADPAFPKPAA